ncbi:hypothetical protein [Poseidonocella sp. HB161398]|uniref:zinc finger domain-containing protein n=1 Tax=Poseidonocella sp. HB161398 TaxID=2320855 RepID=UPI001109381C|nr:hypothetical protein [Poseidonocella sp. HB161398]
MTTTTKTGKRKTKAQRRERYGREVSMAHDEAVLATPCPTCFAAAGERCTWPNVGGSSHAHKARHDLWKAAPDAPAQRVTLSTPPWAA